MAVRQEDLWYDKLIYRYLHKCGFFIFGRFVCVCIDLSFWKPISLAWTSIMLMNYLINPLAEHWNPLILMFIWSSITIRFLSNRTTILFCMVFSAFFCTTNQFKTFLEWILLFIFEIKLIHKFFCLWILGLI